MKNSFISAIHSKKKVCITFYSKEDGGNLARVCAPMDFGPSKRFKDGIDRFHLWDYFPDGGEKPHPLSLEPANLLNLQIRDELFDPADFVKWNTNWIVARDWGPYS